MCCTWRRFLNDHQETIKSYYKKATLPSLCGAILYFAKERKSFSEKPQLDLVKQKNLGDVRMISTFYHNNFYDYVYVEEKVTNDDPAGFFLSLFQFDFSSSSSPLELPITWGHYLNEWFIDEFSFSWLASKLAELLSLKTDEDLWNFLVKNISSLSYRTSNILPSQHSTLNPSNMLKEIYQEEWDDGFLYLLIDNLQHELIEEVSRTTLGQLYKDYEWYFWRFRAQMRKLSSDKSDYTDLST